jgi:serine/threonine protein kinase
MFMMFNEGRHPFYVLGMRAEDFKVKLRTEGFPPLAEPLAQDFIERISKKEYEERYNVNEALKHPWITRNKDD